MITVTQVTIHKQIVATVVQVVVVPVQVCVKRIIIPIFTGRIALLLMAMVLDNVLILVVIVLLV